MTQEIVTVSADTPALFELWLLGHGYREITL